MKNFKKVAHGKFFRVVLTQEGRLFFNGQSRRYMFGSGMNRDSHLQHFHEIENNFFVMDEGDKMIDVTGGKNFVAVATERGKVYGSSYMFFRHFQECRSNQ